MKEICSKSKDILIDPEEELNNTLNQKDFIEIKCPRPSNYNLQPLKDIPYLKDHQNNVSLSKNILNNDEPLVIDKSKEIKIKEVFSNTQDSLPSKNDSKEKNNNSLKVLYGDNSRYKHTKFSDDNLRRKCKVIVLNYVKDFINEKIASIYKSNPKKNVYK